MKSVFLVGAVQAFFLAVLLLSKKNKITADYVLAFWLIVTGIPLLLYFINYDEYSLILNHSKSIPTYLMIVNIPLLLIQSPFLYIYVSYIAKNEKKFKPVYLFNFLPAVLFIIAYSIIIGFGNKTQDSFNLYDYEYFRVILLFFPLTVILAFFYIIKSYFRITKYRKTIQNQFSYTENIDFNWLKNLILIISVVWLILGISAILFKNIHLLFNIHDVVLLSVSVAIFVIGYFGFLRTNIFLYKMQTDNELVKSGKVKSMNNTPDKTALKQIEELRTFMSEQKPYLESKLSVKQLAEMIQVSPHQLSEIINSYLHKNFFDFINEYRVEEFKNQIKENKNYTILGVAYNCGFNSKSSFNRIFKIFTGFTPSEYQKTHHSQQ